MLTTRKSSYNTDDCIHYFCPYYYLLIQYLKILKNLKKLKNVVDKSL